MQQHRSIAARLLLDFAERTGLSSSRAQARYLWTDAFAVCGFLALYQSTAEREYSDLAFRLIDSVHHVLGRHRVDDKRTGWLSGLGQEAEEHPTRGGLRIGKPLPERPPGQAPDERLEWDRDGQYFHYLTKWMTALNHAAGQSGDPRFNLWARELADAAHGAFVYRVDSVPTPRMFWKMSVDLSRPLVSSMGQHDPLDGYVTYRELQATASQLGADPRPALAAPVADFESMLRQTELLTADPLGLGGLLMDAYRLKQLDERTPHALPGLFDRVLAAALLGLRHYSRQGELRRAASQRLAFRELGLALGLHGLELLVGEANQARPGLPIARETRALLSALAPYLALRSEIQSFWLADEHQRAATWLEHRDIDEVMLATSLMPEACLVMPRRS
jgi:hypothetical protein